MPDQELATPHTCGQRADILRDRESHRLSSRHPDTVQALL